MQRKGWQEVDDKCPLCSAQLFELREYTDNQLMEEYQECRNCTAYYFDFAVGIYKYIIGTEEFIWNYTTTDEEVVKIKASVDIARFKHNS